MPKIVDKDKKREKLIQAAIPIFAKHGFRETKMSDIAISADVGKGTLYEYFESKDDLFLSAFKIWFSYFSEQMQDIISKEKNAYKQLEIFYEQFFKTVEEYGSMYYIYFDFWSELTRNPRLHKQDIAVIYQTLRDLFANILENGAQKNVFKSMEYISMSTALIAISDGLLIQWLVDQTSFSIYEVGMSAIRSFLDSLVA
ncbi:MAG: hypothetical protein A2Y40_03475 [Candidatus Margulisbacteria bacterium GWF2_35_9]|nr:MAG: hypothetical protein A2Y40_03475 [Candidatus Margulisbacteria bacterium GWF2_35_9]